MSNKLHHRFAFFLCFWFCSTTVFGMSWKGRLATYLTVAACGYALANRDVIYSTAMNGDTKVLKAGQETDKPKRPIFPLTAIREKVFKLSTDENLAPELFLFDDRKKSEGQKIGYAKMFNEQAVKEGVQVLEQDVLKLVLEDITLIRLSENRVKLVINVAPYHFPFEKELDLSSLQRGDEILVPLYFQRDKIVYKVTFTGEMKIKYEADWGVLTVRDITGKVKVNVVGAKGREEAFSVPDVIGK